MSVEEIDYTRRPTVKTSRIGKPAMTAFKNTNEDESGARRDL
jgi:hypothetical protein